MRLDVLTVSPNRQYRSVREYQKVEMRGCANSCSWSKYLLAHQARKLLGGLLGPKNTLSYRGGLTVDRLGAEEVKFFTLSPGG